MQIKKKKTLPATYFRVIQIHIYRMSTTYLTQESAQEKYAKQHRHGLPSITGFTVLHLLCGRHWTSRQKTKMATQEIYGIKE